MLTVILRATLSSWETSSLILWTIRRSGPPSGGGSERWARMVLPETKCNCTAAWSFFSASKPCHTIGYFWKEKVLFLILCYLMPEQNKQKKHVICIYRQKLHSVNGTMSSMFQLGIRPRVYCTGSRYRWWGRWQKSRRTILQREIWLVSEALRGCHGRLVGRGHAIPL